MTYGTGGRVEVEKCNDQHMGYGLWCLRSEAVNYAPSLGGVAVYCTGLTPRLQLGAAGGVRYQPQGLCHCVFDVRCLLCPLWLSSPCVSMLVLPVVDERPRHYCAAGWPPFDPPAWRPSLPVPSMIGGRKRSAGESCNLFPTGTCSLQGGRQGPIPAAPLSLSAQPPYFSTVGSLSAGHGG